MQPTRNLLSALALTLMLAHASAFAGARDPDCTPGNAAKNAAAKATGGGAGRCAAGDTAANTTKGTASVNAKKKKNDDTSATKKAGEKVPKE